MGSLIASNSTSHFPKIFRFITEQGKLFILSFTTFVVIGGIVIQIQRMEANRTQLALLKNQRVQMTKELAYWQDVARQYPNYRDVVFRIASLQYELGQTNEAAKSLQKVFALDPNFKEGNVLGAKIKAH